MSVSPPCIFILIVRYGVNKESCAEGAIEINKEDPTFFFFLFFCYLQASLLFTISWSWIAQIVHRRMVASSAAAE